METARALRRWLPEHGRLAAELEGAFIVLRTSGRLQAVAHWPEKAIGEAGALEAASAALSAGRRTFTWCDGTRASRTCAIAHPLSVGDGWTAVAILVMRRDDAPPIELMERLDASAATWADEPEPAGSPELVTVLRLLEAVFAIDDPQRAGAMFAAQLSAALGCNRVSLGLRCNDRMVIAGSAEHRAFELPETEAEVTALAETALRLGFTLLRTTADAPAGPVATRWPQGSNREPCSICVVPWFAKGQAVGAVVCERPVDEPFTDQDVQWIETASRAAAPWFLLKKRSNLTWLRGLRESAHKLLRGRSRNTHAWVEPRRPPVGHVGPG